MGGAGLQAWEKVRRFLFACFALFFYRLWVPHDPWGLSKPYKEGPPLTVLVIVKGLIT